MTMEDHDVHDLITQLDHLKRRNAKLTAHLTHFADITFHMSGPQNFYEAPYTGGGIYVGKRAAQRQARKTLAEDQLAKILGETRGPDARRALIESITRRTA